MRSSCRRLPPLLLCLGMLLAVVSRPAAAAECCGPGGCSTCKPKWEDKKTKKPKYSQKCSEECGRGFDAWCDHGCCAEDTPPCGHLFTRKKLYKKEEDKVERVLKYEVLKAAAEPCQLPPCDDCGRPWYDPLGLLRHCFGL